MKEDQTVKLKALLNDKDHVIMTLTKKISEFSTKDVLKIRNNLITKKEKSRSSNG